MQSIEALWAWVVAAFGHENPLLENVSFLATIIGVPLLVITYLSSMHDEAERREYGTYDALETKYVEFQRMTLRFPRLDVAEAPLDPPPADLTPSEIIQQRTLYMVLFSLFERAWLMYHTRRFFGRRRLREAQWRGWASYIDRYCARESCARAWFNYEPPRVDVRQDFDNRFEQYMMSRFVALGRLPKP